MVLSSSERNDSARLCLAVANALRWARSAAVEGSTGDSFVGLADAPFFFRGKVDGESSLSDVISICSSCLSRFCFRGETRGFAGEWVSFQVLTTSGHQKASRLGRRFGALGMRFVFLDGETSLTGLGGGSGGVLGRSTGGAFRGERCFVGVGELDFSLAKECVRVDSRKEDTYNLRTPGPSLE